MRPRHWKQLVRVTGGAVQISNEGLTRMTLGQLLELGLHGEWCNNLQLNLFGKHDKNILFGYFIMRELNRAKMEMENFAETWIFVIWTKQ